MTPLAEIGKIKKKPRGNSLADLIRTAHLGKRVSDLDEAAEMKQNSPQKKGRK